MFPLKIKTTYETMRNYYALVNVDAKRLGTYVSAENVPAAFEAATFKCQARHPRLHVETMAVQEIAAEYAAPDKSASTSTGGSGRQIIWR